MTKHQRKWARIAMMWGLYLSSLIAIIGAGTALWFLSEKWVNEAEE